MDSPDSVILLPDSHRFVVPFHSRPDNDGFVVSFDTSGIDQLERETDQDRRALIAGLKTLGRVRVTGLNVSESAGILVGDHRKRRMELLDELTGQFWPLRPPNELLGDIARAYHEHRGSLPVGDKGCWIAVKNREAVDDAMASESFRWNQDREDWFLGMHRDLRSRYAPLFAAFRNERPRSAAFMIRYFIERGPQYWDLLLIPIFERQTGHHPTHDEFEQFLKRVPAWAMFWFARIYALFWRAVRERTMARRTRA